MKNKQTTLFLSLSVLSCLLFLFLMHKEAEYLSQSSWGNVLLKNDVMVLFTSKFNLIVPEQQLRHVKAYYLLDFGFILSYTVVFVCLAVKHMLAQSKSLFLLTILLIFPITVSDIIENTCALFYNNIHLFDFSSQQLKYKIYLFIERHQIYLKAMNLKWMSAVIVAFMLLYYTLKSSKYTIRGSMGAVYSGVALLIAFQALTALASPSENIITAVLLILFSVFLTVSVTAIVSIISGFRQS